MPNPQKPELIELLINSEIISTANDDYVKVLNPERPQGFTEHFAQLLSRTPNIHSPNKSEFFPHFFLGSVVTLPYTDLMYKLKIEKIFFDINAEGLKLVFKIKYQDGYKLKLFIVTDNKSAVSFTNQELSEIKGNTSDSKKSATTQVEYHVLRILKDDGFKLQVSSEDIREKFSKLDARVNNEETIVFLEIQKTNEAMQFGPLVDKLSSTKPEDVQASFEAILKSLKNLYIKQKNKLADLKSEASYHGFIYGFFALNYKYTNDLDCYVEQIQGHGFSDISLLSRIDSKGRINNNPYLIVSEIKNGVGAASAIFQIEEKGYVYNLPNVRTKAEKAIIAGVDFGITDTNGKLQDIAVEVVDLHQVKVSLVSGLVGYIQSGKGTEDIKLNIMEQIKALYYNLSIKRKEAQYLSGVLLGQSLALDQDTNAKNFIFDYGGTITGGIVMTLCYQYGNQGVILSIVEKQSGNRGPELDISESSRTRSTAKAKTADWCMIPVHSLDISDVITVQIVINTDASSFEGKAGKEKGYIDSINVVKLESGKMTQMHNGKFIHLDKLPVSDVIYSMFDLSDVDAAPLPKKMKLGLAADHNKIDIEKVLNECFANGELGKFIRQESDVQAILHGCFLGQQYEGRDVRVFSEVSYGDGRSDLRVSISDAKDGRKERVALFEMKFDRSSSISKQQSLFLSSKLQLVDYIKYLKSSTDSKEVSAISVIYSANKEIYFERFNSKIDHTSHSSSAEQKESSDSRSYRQEEMVPVINSKLLSTFSKTGVLDFSLYHFSTIDYILLKNFFINRYPVLKGSLQLNLSNKRDIVEHMDIVAEILQYDVWINDFRAVDCGLQYKERGLERLVNALISKEKLKVLESGSAVQKEFISQNKGRIKTFFLQSLDLSENPLDVKAAQLLSEALMAMKGLKRFAVSKISGDGIEYIVDGLKRSSALVSLKIASLEGGLSIHGVSKVVELFAKHTMLEELDLSGNRMGQSSIDTILGALKENIQKLDLSKNCIDDAVINVKSLSDFISRNSKLESLKFTHNKIEDTGLLILQDVLQNHPSLKILDLSSNKISDVDHLFQTLEDGENVLTDLILRDNKITQLPETFCSLLVKKGLKYLNIAYNPIENLKERFATLAQEQHLISYLDLSGIALNREIIDSLAAWMKLNQYLESLSLSECGINDRYATIIFDALTVKYTKLKSLDLSKNSIEIAEPRVLQGLLSTYRSLAGFISSNSVLEELNLAENSINDNGGKSLIEELEQRNKKIKKLPKLSIDLSRNKLTNDFVSRLSDVLPRLSVLKSLALKDNNFSLKQTNQLVNAVEGNHDIQHFDISGNTVHLDDIVRLSSYLIRNSAKTVIAEEEGYVAMHAIGCLNIGRSKRFIKIDCKISWDDVDEISSVKTRNKEEIIIDADKFLKYSRQHVYDIEKSKQLLSLANEMKRADSERIVGDYKNVLDQVIEVGSYKRYIEHERLHYLGHHALTDDNIMPQWKVAFVKGAGRIQMGYGLYGTFVSCKHGRYDIDSGVDCMLNTAEIGYSFLSQPIANKPSTKIGSNVLAQKFGTTFAKSASSMIAKGMIEVGSGVFDIIDITRSSIELIACSKRADGETPCSDKEIRDSIASISISGISCISGIVLFGLGASTVVIVAVGAVILVVRVIYGAISNVIEYSAEYDTIASENWSIFWRTALFQEMSEDIAHLAARHKTVNLLTKDAWKMLKNLPDDVVAISLGLGKEYIEYVEECRLETVPLLWDGTYPCPDCYISYQECYPVPRIDAHPAYSKIDMSHKHYNNTMKLSRVLPIPIENATMLCLPKMTREGYEKGLSKSSPEAVFKCENAAVLLHKQRAATQSTDSSKTMIHYLKYVDSGAVIGSLEWNNYFAIFGGNTSIFGTSVQSNIFELLGNDYSGNIYLSANSSNILKVSSLKEFKNVKVEYNHTIPLSMHMFITIDGMTSRLYALQQGVKVQYVGGDATLDEVVCNFLFHSNLDKINPKNIGAIIIDSGGVRQNIGNWHDSIKNCYTVLMSPNTFVEGDGQGYVVYVKRPDYKHGEFASRIEIPDGASIIFHMSFFEECKKIEYSASSNDLNIYIPLSEGGAYQVSLSRYMAFNNTTNYVLIDRHGANIVPLRDINHTAIKNFLIRKDIPEIFSVENATQYYQNTSYKGDSYHISTELRYMQGHVCIFGSIDSDLMIENADIVLISGGEGSDIYVIDDQKKEELYIYNYSNDLVLDFLTIPSIKNLTIGLAGHDVLLHFLSKKIILCDYLRDRKYQHLVITDYENYAVIPFYDGNWQISVKPFYYTSTTQNVYVLSHNITSGVIGIHSEHAEFYIQENNLLITDKREPFGILNIILQDYYVKPAQWEQVSLYYYNDGLVGDVIDLSNIVLSKASGLISNIYNNTVHEYIVDLNKQGEKIDHNNELGLGIILFQNMSLDDVMIISYEKHLILRHSVSHHNLVLQHWYKKEHKKILALEFNDGVEAIRIWLSDGFEQKINLNHKLNNKIATIGSNVLTAVLDFMVSYCAKLHVYDHDNYENYFLIDEFENVIKTSTTLNSEEVVKILDAPYNASKTLMLLLTKNYNRLLLEYPHIEKKDLHKMGQNCFDTMVSHQDIEELIHLLNSTSVKYKQVKSFIDNRKEKMKQIIKQHAHTDWSTSTHHKHRHHHGEDILNHQRTSRNIKEQDKQDDDIIQYHQDGVSVSSIGESISTMQSDNLTWV